MTKKHTVPPERERGPNTLVEVRLPLDRPLPTPFAANYFHLAHAGLDVVLSVGQVDVTKVGSKAPDADDVVRLEAEVTHRFMMSVGSFVQLRALVDQISKQLSAQGVRIPAAPGEGIE